MKNSNVVLKFGGSSVADAAHWQTIASQIQQNLDQKCRPLLVLSALKNVSNLLEALLHQSLAGVYPVATAQLKELHLGFANQLDLDLQVGSDLSLRLNHWFEQLEADCLSIFQSKSITPQNHAKVLAIGELLSSSIGAEYLLKQGFDVFWLDAREILKSKDQQDPWHHYTSAQCEYQNGAFFDEYVSSKSPKEPSIIVTQGFIASDQNNNTVLLGREGSDTSAAYFAAMLKAQKLEIWTDVTGVFSANPREISGTVYLPKLSYQQALLMAEFGAKVLHPRVIGPVEENGIPIYVRSTSKSEHQGTLIGKNSESKNGVKAIVYESKTTHFVSTPPVDGQGFDSIHENLARLGFDQLLLCEVEDEYHFILNYVNSDQAQPLIPTLLKAFARCSVSVSIEKALITLVGESSDLNWIENAKALICELVKDKLIQLYIGENNDRLSLLVESGDCLQISQLLHRALIENRVKQLTL